jgi:hypothetical protein
MENRTVPETDNKNFLSVASPVRLSASESAVGAEVETVAPPEKPRIQEERRVELSPQPHIQTAPSLTTPTYATTDQQQLVPTQEIQTAPEPILVTPQQSSAIVTTRIAAVNEKPQQSLAQPTDRPSVALHAEPGNFTPELLCSLILNSKNLSSYRTWRLRTHRKCV